jgi:hypothetical protein
VLVLLLVPGLSAGAILLTLLLGRRMDRLQSLLPEWAERNGYRIVQQETRTFFQGPFFYSSRYFWVCHITVEDWQGNRRAGWVRVGSWPLGCVFSDQIDVRWDAPGVLEGPPQQTDGGDL